MLRIGIVTVCLVALFAMATGCGDSGSSDAQQSGRSAVPAQKDQTEPVETAGRPAVPPLPPETVEGLMLEPFFDAEGTQTSMAVAPGELFHLYICAKHPNIDIKTAQWRLEVPEGVEVIGEAKQFEGALSMGSHRSVFVITFPCQTGGETAALLKYNCMATAEFQGGEFRTVETELATDGVKTAEPFLGFVNCGRFPEMLPATGGVATVSIK